VGKWSCDPYQPLERKYELTRKCLQILVSHGWPVTIQTKSPLVLRDIDILKSGDNLEVGLSVTTSDDSIRRLFEPNAPPIGDRVRALGELHLAGMRTFAMVAPMLIPSYWVLTSNYFQMVSLVRRVVEGEDLFDHSPEFYGHYREGKVNSSISEVSPCQEWFSHARDPVTGSDTNDNPSYQCQKAKDKQNPSRYCYQRLEYGYHFPYFLLLLFCFIFYTPTIILCQYGRREEAGWLLIAEKGVSYGSSVGKR